MYDMNTTKIGDPFSEATPLGGKPNTDVASRKLGLGKRLNQRKKS
jgi:hypothetical protein